ncbi:MULTISPECIES: hypothetical protein [unclassified Agrobacterium]|jgi:hypothetical protein|uniref:hypothetical protein n=1 Tax=unclassified Agrobacterium TaxID=2632611 RepID=UPI00244BB1BB|nr:MULTISPECIES: hypothetical protein [unclassified Agrobacterium]MDH0614340.1 hypothetical protein [Agrobacterium sp. GD03872]MDH0695366.1 hypothetical protein [Agrobacterium sp. GD03871]MDH1058268.1 hypothetical protein [Agrobacterium sp. GD03992]MDH2209791.1 hypothetical protein [Agrobacterium sp. GD03643]MDH2219195.1 hypothetical protein [Agrobacterium sp. GD03638]
MRLPLAIPAFLAAMSAPALAQTATDEGSISLSSGGSSTIKQLLSSGYEIKASVPNGSKFIVFMQKDKAAYACEFVTVARSRCETLN